MSTEKRGKLFRVKGLNGVNRHESGMIIVSAGMRLNVMPVDFERPNLANFRKSFIIMHHISRRYFIKTSSLTTAAFLTGLPIADEKVMTVQGWLSAKKMGRVLPHEHVLVDFAGADSIDTSKYDLDEIFRAVLPQLQALKAAGCDTLIDCTPNYLGRSPQLLKRLSESSGLHLLTNTGYYGAVGHKYLPAHVETETPRQLAGRWLDEWQNGIEGAGVRPGFLKISVDKAPLSELQRKVVEAAALAHLDSGLTIASHTIGGEAAMEQLEILQKNGVSPEAFIWIHAQSETDTSYQLKAARMGAWVEFDGLNANYLKSETVNQHLDFLNFMKKENLLHRSLLSQDAGWYAIGEPDGGKLAPFTYLFDEFLPKLRETGFSRKDLRVILRENPAKAFSIKIRRRAGG